MEQVKRNDAQQRALAAAGVAEHDQALTVTEPFDKWQAPHAAVGDGVARPSDIGRRYQRRGCSAAGAPLTLGPADIGALGRARGLTDQHVCLKEPFEQRQCGPAILVTDRTEAARVDELELSLIDAGELRADPRKGSAVESRAEAVGNVLSEQRYDPRAPEEIIDKHRLVTQAVSQILAVERRKDDAGCGKPDRLALDFLLHLSRAKRCLDGNGEPGSTSGPVAGKEQIDRVAQLRRTKAAMALGLKAMVAASRQTRENVDAFLRITLPSVARTVFDITVKRRQAVAETLKILPAQRIEWQHLDTRYDVRHGGHRVGRAEYVKWREGGRRSGHRHILALQCRFRQRRLNWHGGKRATVLCLTTSSATRSSR